MRWCRHPWVNSLGVSSLALATGVLTFLFISGHLSAQTAPLSGGSSPTDVASHPHEASPRLFAGPKGEALRLWYRGLPPGMGGILLGVASSNDAWQTLVEIVPRKRDDRRGGSGSRAGGDWRWHPVGRRCRAPSRSEWSARLRWKTWIQPSTPSTPPEAFAPKVPGDAAEFGRGVVGRAEKPRGYRMWDIYARSSPDGGATWGPERLLSRFPQHSQSDAYIRPELVSDGEDNVWAVWVGIRSGRSRLFLSRSTDGGRNWADPLELSGESKSVFGQRVVRAGQRLLVVWQDKRTGRDRLFSTSSPDGGVTWTSPIQVDHLSAEFATDAYSPPS